MKVITLLLAFLIITTTIIIIKIKTTNQEPAKAEFIQPRLAEQVINIKTTTTEKQKIQTKIDDYTLLKKPFDNTNYAYDERTKDFRFVCKNPCPVSKAILDQEFAAITYAVSTLRGLTQIDINQDLIPFEAHASEDEVCPKIEGALAYASGWYVDKNGYKRGKLCFFFDTLDYDRTKFPYSTSVHEVTHLFEFERIEDNRPIWEGLAEVMESFFLRGTKTSFCDQHNKWWLSEMGINPHDPHDTGRELFFQLCDQYGFDYGGLAELFKNLDSLGRGATTQEFIQIINNIVGRDTTHLFQEAGAI